MQHKHMFLYEASVRLKLYVQDKQNVLISLTEWIHMLCKTRSPLDKALKTFTQRGIVSIDITQPCYPHTLSPSTNRTITPSTLMARTHSHTHDKSVIHLDSFPCPVVHYESWLGKKTHKARSSARSGQLTILKSSKVTQCLARWVKLDSAGHFIKSMKWEASVKLLQASVFP